MPVATTNGPRPTLGAVAPDFTLTDTERQSVSLSQFRGQSAVLLAFFPLAFTGTCTAELCAFSEDFDQFSGKGVTVLPISVDSSASLKEFRTKYDMKVQILSDFKREASAAYGVLNEAQFRSERAYFLLDAEGVLRWSYVEDAIGTRRENAEIFAAIDAL
jgi:peroxiredoxin